MAVQPIENHPMIRDLTPGELADIQKQFPGVKEGDYYVHTIISEAYLLRKPEPGKPASNNPPEMPEKGSL